MMIWLGFGCLAGAADPLSSPPPSPSHRIVAIGDLHADLPQTLAVLRMAGVIDESGEWIAGATKLVQTGDLTDRGPDSLEVIGLLDQLAEQAAAQGGEVISLLGNHEVMNLTGDWRYVSPQDVDDFGSVQARQAAFAADGFLGRSLLARESVAQVQGTIFVHGGVSARTALAAGSAAALSAQVRAALAGVGPTEVLGEEGPLWYRGYLLAPEAVACEELRQTLSVFGAQRMVVGHTTQRSGTIAVRCGGQLLGIDTGISAHYGGNLAALEIVDGDAVAVYPTGKSDLPDP